MQIGVVFFYKDSNLDPTEFRVKNKKILCNRLSFFLTLLACLKIRTSIFFPILIFLVRSEKPPEISLKSILFRKLF
jgi:hypothetical protein